MNKTSTLICGVGLGLRQEFFDTLKAVEKPPMQFLEIAPENWINVGGKRREHLLYYAERYPIICHGVSLSLGGLAPLDEDYLLNLKQFIAEHNIQLFSDHLCFGGDEQGLLYDLLPIPFTEEAVHHVAKRIKRSQEILEQRIAIENISYYSTLAKDLDEATFINAVLQEADCNLLLDVNNVYVNSINHHYDPIAFMQKMPKERIAYLHIAGHEQMDKDLLIDTHGSSIINPVWSLLQYVYSSIGVYPTLLERDSNIPPLDDLFKEIRRISAYQLEIVT